MQVTKHYFPVRLFTKLYNVILTFVCVDKILMFDHLDELSYWGVGSCMLLITLWKVRVSRLHKSVDVIIQYNHLVGEQMSGF